MKKMFFFPLLAIILIILTIGFLYFILNRNKSLPLSSYILDITNPVNYFTGTIESLNNGNIIVGQKAYTGKVLTFKVMFDKDTAVYKPYFPIPYLIKPVDNTVPPPLTTAYLKVGQSVYIKTKNDLRLANKSEFTASSITIQGVTNSFNGTIATKNGNTITVKGFLSDIIAQPNPSPPETQSYTILITPDTEISEISQGKVQIVPLSQLSIGQQIQVYTKEDITTSDHLTALRIEPLSPPPAPLPGASSSP